MMRVEEYVLEIIGDLNRQKQHPDNHELWVALRNIEDHCKLISDTLKENRQEDE